MAEPIDITTMSPEEILELLKCCDRPVLCQTPWDRTDFIQSRATTEQTLVVEYEESLSNGDELPPSKGFYIYDLNRFKLFDGIHTATARNNLGQMSFPAFLQLGTITEAEIAAAGANYTNGARRTNADKRNAVALLVRNPETGGRSNNWIAKVAHVSPSLVEEVRIELESDPVNPVSRPKKRRVTRNGIDYQVDDPATKKKKEQPKNKPFASNGTAKQKTPTASKSEAASRTEPLTSETIAQMTIDYLNKQLKDYPVEEHRIVCKMVIDVLQTLSGLVNDAS